MTLREWRESKVVDRLAADRAVHRDPAALAWHRANFGRRPGDHNRIYWDQIVPLDGPQEGAAQPAQLQGQPTPPWPEDLESLPE